MNDPHQHSVFLAALAVAGVAAWLDWRSGKIPNWLTIPVVVAAPFFHIARYRLSGQPTSDAIMAASFAIGGAMLAAIVPLLLYRQSAIGGGDVKLLVALGALLQPRLGIEAQMYGFFAAALLAPAVLAYQGKLGSTIKNAFAIGANLFLPSARRHSIDEAALSWFRLGPAIFLGVALVAYSNW